MSDWRQRIPELHDAFARAAPFPHIVIDDFTDPDLLRAIAHEDFADVGTARWTYHRYYSQKTWSRTDLASFSSSARELCRQLGSEDLRRTLTEVTGIRDLRFDDELEDGGLQATQSGGYLFLHVDPVVHPRRRHWRRRLNLLVYLNEDWRHDDGGELELWDANVSRCHARIRPAFNRAVLFAADERTPHGFPDPLRCPAGVSRNCLAIYYFTEEATAPAPHFGRLFARPGERFARAAVAVDNLALHVYGRLGQTLGLDDRVLNRLMRPFRRRP